MSIDSALTLKKLVRKGEVNDLKTAMPFLENSELINLLVSDFEIDVINVLNRLIELAEIPYALDLPKSKKWISFLLNAAENGAGFSFSGKSDDILACYNAMICSVLIKAGLSDSKEVNIGIKWILDFQSFIRGTESNWKGSRANKYGGCLKTTPCYVGVAKSTIALSDYVKATNTQNDNIHSKLDDGLEYILTHNLYQRQSNGRPIRDYLTKLSYPFSYRVNILELLALMKSHNLIDDPRCHPALELLSKKRKKDGSWYMNRCYQPKYWIDFDKTKQPGLWLTDYIESQILIGKSPTYF